MIAVPMQGQVPIPAVRGATDRAQADHDRAIIRFASVQLFALVFLQKFTLGGQLSVPLLIMLAGVARMVVSGGAAIVGSRLACYLLFAGFCFWSESLAGGSLPSFFELILLYGCMTICATASDAAYRKIIDRFVRFMIVPACIVIVQYAYQKLTGISNPIDIERIVPASLLLQGYNYSGHYPWNSYFIRPNGFFFLEPSYISAFTASAAIMEITYLRRPFLAMLMIVATALTLGATGVIMLLIAAPFLLAREKTDVIVMVVAAAFLALATAAALDAPLPLISRADELAASDSSGGQRITMPASRLAELAFDPSYVFLGDGSGEVSQGGPSTLAATASKSAKALYKAYGGHVAAMNPWPVVKLLNEYGLLATMAFVALYLTGVAGKFNVPMKVALSIVYFFTGGYLLSPPMVELVIFFCFMFAPASAGYERARLQDLPPGQRATFGHRWSAR